MIEVSGGERHRLPVHHNILWRLEGSVAIAEQDLNSVAAETDDGDIEFAVVVEVTQGDVCGPYQSGAGIDRGSERPVSPAQVNAHGTVVTHSHQVENAVVIEIASVDGPPDGAGWAVAQHHALPLEASNGRQWGQSRR